MGDDNAVTSDHTPLIAGRQHRGGDSDLEEGHEADQRRGPDHQEGPAAEAGGIQLDPGRGEAGGRGGVHLRGGHFIIMGTNSGLDQGLTISFFSLV